MLESIVRELQSMGCTLEHSVNVASALVGDLEVAGLTDSERDTYLRHLDIEAART